MKESDKEKYEKKIRELEEKVRRLEKETDKVKKEEGAEVAEEISAGEILRSVGDMFGLGGLIKIAGKLPEFQERLDKVDEELKRKLKTTPFKKTEERTPYQGRGFRARPLGISKSKIREKAPVPREREADIFGEDDYVLVIIEIPGADEKGIEVNLEKDKLAILADKAGKKIHKDIIVPCTPKGKITKSYKNGILEVKIKK